MKRLFTVNGEHFDNKMKAKEYRNQLIEQGKPAKVSKGPDHMGNHGNKHNSWRR